MTETVATATTPPPENVLGEIQTAVRHSLIYGLGNVATKAVGFLMVPFYTHYLAPADYGTLEILDLSMSLFGMFLAMGMVSALLRCYASADTEEQRRKTVSTAFLFVIGTGILAYIALLGFIRPASALIVGPNTPPSYLLLAFTSFILGYILNVPRTYLRAREASGSFVAVDTVSLGLMLALNIVFLVVLKTGLIGILLSSVIVAALQVILLSVWMLKHIPMRFSRPLLKKMLLFGFPLVFANMATFALNFSDRFFLQHLRSLEVVGIYAVGYKFAFMLNYLLVQPFYIMWQSRMYIIHQRPNHREVFGQMFVMYSLLLIYAGLALATLSPEIMRFMVDARFAGGREVIPVVALAYVFYGIGYYAQLGMFLMDKTGHVGAVGAGAAALNLALNYVLVSKFGMMGAAWATALSFGALALASYFCSNRVMPLPLGVSRVAAGLTLGIGVYVLCRAFTPASVSASLAMKAAVLAVFPLILWKARILSPAENATLVSAASGVSKMIGFRFGRAAG
jgi:O-antigen/teichoic acid export membrane protein